MVAWMINLTIFAAVAVLPKLASVIAWVIDLAIFASETVRLKSGTDGSMSNRLGNFCDGSSYAAIEHR